MRIWAVEVLSAMHHVDLIVDLLALLDKYGRFAVGSATKGEGCVTNCRSAICGNNGVET